MDVISLPPSSTTIYRTPSDSLNLVYTYSSVCRMRAVGCRMADEVPRALQNACRATFTIRHTTHLVLLSKIDRRSFTSKRRPRHTPLTAKLSCSTMRTLRSTAISTTTSWFSTHEIEPEQRGLLYSTLPYPLPYSQLPYLHYITPIHHLPYPLPYPLELPYLPVRRRPAGRASARGRFPSMTSSPRRQRDQCPERPSWEGDERRRHEWPLMNRQTTERGRWFDTIGTYELLLHQQQQFS